MYTSLQLFLNKIIATENEIFTESVTNQYILQHAAQYFYITIPKREYRICGWGGRSVEKTAITVEE